MPFRERQPQDRSEAARIPAPVAMLALLSLLGVSGFVRAGNPGDETSPPSAKSRPLDSPELSRPAPTVIGENTELRRVDFRVVRHGDKQPIPGATVLIFSHY